MIRSPNAIQYAVMNGFNPTVSKGADLRNSLLANSLINTHQSDIQKVVYYGAGMAKPANIELVQNLLFKIFPLSEIELKEDMSGAIRASSMIDDQDRMVCILGTGCNIALVHNGQITDGGVSLGYILGDEGSGAHLAKKFLSNVLRDAYTDQILNEALELLNCSSREDVVTSLYKHPKPNQFLASLCPLIKKHQEIEPINQLVNNCFQDFVDVKLNRFASNKNLPIYFIGSIATHFEESLKQVLAENGYTYASNIQKPLEKLVEFELNRSTPQS